MLLLLLMLLPAFGVSVTTSASHTALFSVVPTVRTVVDDAGDVVVTDT